MHEFVHIKQKPVLMIRASGIGPMLSFMVACFVWSITTGYARFASVKLDTQTNKRIQAPKHSQSHKTGAGLNDLLTGGELGLGHIFRNETRHKV
jgi:hypothetical protein